MPAKKVIIFFVCLVLGAWFFTGENKSFGEKLFIVFFVIFLYVAYMLLSGATIDEILAIVR